MAEKLLNRLESMKGNNKLKDEVIEWAINYDSQDDEGIKNAFKDLFMSGCQSGTVGHLIYYVDTHKFFDEYYDEIMELVEDFQEMTGEYLQWEGDLKNWFAWFGFEEQARKIAYDLDLDV